MKKITECSKCHSKFDSFLKKCPYCETRNEYFPLDKKYQKILFLTDYKELLIFLTGFLFFPLLAFFFNIALKNSPMDQSLIVGLTNFLAYFLTLAIIFCIISYDFKFLFIEFKKLRPIIVGLILAALMIGFSYAYQGILHAAGQKIIDSDNQRIITEICKKFPALAFFTTCLIGPITEECTYRLGLYSLLRKKNRWLAYVITIFLFVLIHFNFFSTNLANECLNLPLYFFPSIILCIAFEYEGFSSCLYGHVLNNLISFIIVMAL